jgi:hypothetical protein
LNRTEISLYTSETTMIRISGTHLLVAD